MIPDGRLGQSWGVADWLTPQQRSFNMSRIRSAGTKPEVRLLALLEAMYPADEIVAHPPDLPGRPDFVLPEIQVALFVDGCFWHGCPKHGRIPEDNRDYWEQKLRRNRIRHRLVAHELRNRGYVPVRVWDHELKSGTREARRKIRRAVKRAQLSSGL